MVAPNSLACISCLSVTVRPVAPVEPSALLLNVPSLTAVHQTSHKTLIPLLISCAMPCELCLCSKMLTACSWRQSSFVLFGLRMRIFCFIISTLVNITSFYPNDSLTVKHGSATKAKQVQQVSPRIMRFITASTVRKTAPPAVRRRVVKNQNNRIKLVRCLKALCS